MQRSVTLASKTPPPNPSPPPCKLLFYWAPAGSVGSEPPNLALTTPPPPRQHSRVCACLSPVSRTRGGHFFRVGMAQRCLSGLQGPWPGPAADSTLTPAPGRSPGGQGIGSALQVVGRREGRGDIMSLLGGPGGARSPTHAQREAAGLCLEIKGAMTPCDKSVLGCVTPEPPENLCLPPPPAAEEELVGRLNFGGPTFSVPR